MLYFTIGQILLYREFVLVKRNFDYEPTKRSLGGFFFLQINWLLGENPLVHVKD